MQIQLIISICCEVGIFVLLRTIICYTWQIFELCTWVMMDAKSLFRSLRKRYVDVQKANPHTMKDREAMSKYLRNKFVFFGFKKPLRLTVDKPFVDENKTQLQDRTLLLQLLPLLWEQDEREFQYFGTELARKFKKELLGETELEFNEAIDCLHQLITTRSWWDTVDMLASGGNKSFLVKYIC